MGSSDALLSLFARRPAAAEMTPEEELELRGQQSSLLQALSQQKSPYENTLEMSLAAALPALGTALAGGGSMSALGYGAVAGARGVESYGELMKAQQEKDRTASLLELSNIQNRLDAASMYRSEQAKNKALLERAKATTGLGQLLEAGGTKEDFLAQKEAQSGLVAAQTERALRPPSEAGAREDQLVSDLEKNSLADMLITSSEGQSPQEQERKRILAEQIRQGIVTRGAFENLINIENLGGRTKRTEADITKGEKRTELEAQQFALSQDRLNFQKDIANRRLALQEERIKSQNELNELKAEYARTTDPLKKKKLEQDIAAGQSKLQIEMGPPNEAQLIAINQWNTDNPDNLIELPENATFADAKANLQVINDLNEQKLAKAKGEAAKNRTEAETTSVTQPSLSEFAEGRGITLPAAQQPTKKDRIAADEATAAYKSLKPKIEELKAFFKRNNNNIPTRAGTKEYGEFSRITSSIINDIRKLQNLGANFTRMEETNVWQQAIGGRGDIDPTKLTNFFISLQAKAQNMGGIDFLGNTNAFARSIEQGYVNTVLQYKFLPPQNLGISITLDNVKSLNIPLSAQKEILREYTFSKKQDR